MASVRFYYVDVSDAIGFMQAVVERYRDGGALWLQGSGLPADWPGMEHVVRNPHGDGEDPAGPVVGIPLTEANAAVLVRDMLSRVPWRDGSLIAEVHWGGQIVVSAGDGFAPGGVTIADMDDEFLDDMVCQGIVSAYRLVSKPTFGDVLFGGSRFIRWTLIPVLLLFATCMPFLMVEWTPTTVIGMAATGLLCLLLALGLFDPRRFGWAFRGVTGMVFLAYTAYFVHEVLFDDRPLWTIGRRSETSAVNALLGFVIIGIPCLWHALFGRFRLRR